jgi:hypothetical protein
LKHDDKSKVSSIFLDLLEKSGTASEILREVLGVPVTMPKWVEVKLKEISDKYKDSDFTESSFRDLKADLKSINLDKYLPETISGLDIK